MRDDAASLQGSCLCLCGARLTIVGLSWGVDLGRLREGLFFLWLGGRWWDPVARSVQLIGIYIETCKVSGAEAGGEGDVGCVASRRHQNSSKSAVVVASVQVDPFTVEEDLVPRAEVARAAIWAGECHRCIR